MTAPALPHTQAGFLSPAAIDFLLARPLLARLATVGPDGQPHVAPVWFWWDGHSLFMETDRAFRKARNLRANARCAVTIDETLGGLRFWGIVMSGEAELIEAPPEWVLATVRQIYAKYLGPEGLQAPTPQRMLNEGQHVIVKLTPRRVITWDDTHTGLAPIG